MRNQGHLLLKNQLGGHAAAMHYNTRLLMCNQGRDWSHDAPEAAALNVRRFSTAPDDYPVDTYALEQQVKGKNTYKRITVDLPEKVHRQNGGTCVFHSIAYYLEWYMLKHHGKRVEIDIERFVHDYEKVTMVPFGYDRVLRAIRALNICRGEGVIATSCDDPRKQVRVRISGYECGDIDGSDDLFKTMNDFNVFNELDEGIPLLGSIPVGNEFDSLGSRIYDVTTEVKLVGTHMVMFVGYGRDKGRAYLVFVNSHGEKWGENGLGCVYFDQVIQLEHDKGYRFIKLNGVVFDEPPSPRNPTTGWQILRRRYLGLGKYKGILPGHPTSDKTHEPDDEKPDPRNQISCLGQVNGDTGHRSARDEQDLLDEVLKHESGQQTHVGSPGGDEVSAHARRVHT